MSRKLATDEHCAPIKSAEPAQTMTDEQRRFYEELRCFPVFRAGVGFAVPDAGIIFSASDLRMIADELDRRNEERDVLHKKRDEIACKLLEIGLDGIHE